MGSAVGRGEGVNIRKCLFCDVPRAEILPGREDWSMRQYALDVSVVASQLTVLQTRRCWSVLFSNPATVVRDAVAARLDAPCFRSGIWRT